MVEFLPGSGFYPPTINSFSDINSIENYVLVNNETKTLTITAPDIIQATTISYNLAIKIYSSPQFDNAKLIVTIKYNNDIISTYASTPLIIGGPGVFVDNVFQTFNQKLGKGDTIQMVINVTGGGAGGITLNASLGISGSYSI